MVLVSAGVSVSAFATTSSSGIDLRRSAAPALTKVHQAARSKVPSVVQALPVARGYRGLINTQALGQVDDLYQSSRPKINETLLEYEKKVSDIIAEEISSLPGGSGQNFFSSYLGVSLGRQTGPWDDHLVRDPYLRGSVFGAYLGFGRFFQSNLYLGGETFYHVTTGEFAGEGYRYQNHYDVGMAALPGFQVSHGFAYLRTGFIYGRVQRKTTPLDSYDFDETKPGFQFGLGYNFYLTRRWHTRVDYAYNRFSNVSVKPEGQVKKTYKPAGNSYTVGMSYFLSSLNFEDISAPSFRQSYFLGFYMDIPNHFEKGNQGNLPGNTTVPSEETNALDGFLGGLHAGYHYRMMQRVAVSPELFVTLTDRTFEEKANFNNQWKNTFGYGASVLLGYMVKDSTMMYLRGGFGQGHFESVVPEGTSSQAKSLSLTQYGLGGEATITKRFTFRVEYSNDSYSTLKPADEHFTFALNFYL